MFTKTFNLVPNVYSVRLGYNDTPFNMIKVHIQYSLQCYDKTKDYEKFSNDDEYQKQIVGMRRLPLVWLGLPIGCLGRVENRDWRAENFKFVG